MASAAGGKHGGWSVFFLFIFLGSAVIWALTVALWLLGLLVLVGGVLGAGYIGYRAWARVGRATELQAIDFEVAAMAQECASDLRDLQVDLARIILAKGIGTKFQEQMVDSKGVIGRLDDECEAAIRMCEDAPATLHRLQAIANGEKVRRKVRETLE